MKLCSYSVREMIQLILFLLSLDFGASQTIGSVQVRLRLGRTPYDGHVEVQYNNTWEKVCNQFTRSAGEAVCQKLGYGQLDSIVQASGPYLRSGVTLSCSGESSCFIRSTTSCSTYRLNVVICSNMSLSTSTFWLTLVLSVCLFWCLCAMCLPCCVACCLKCTGKKKAPYQSNSGFSTTSSSPLTNAPLVSDCRQHQHITEPSQDSVYTRIPAEHTPAAANPVQNSHPQRSYNHNISASSVAIFSGSVPQQPSAPMLRTRTAESLPPIPLTDSPQQAPTTAEYEDVDDNSAQVNQNLYEPLDTNHAYSESYEPLHIHEGNRQNTAGINLRINPAYGSVDAIGGSNISGCSSGNRVSGQKSTAVDVGRQERLTVQLTGNPAYRSANMCMHTPDNQNNMLTTDDQIGTDGASSYYEITDLSDGETSDNEYVTGDTADNDNVYI